MLMLVFRKVTGSAVRNVTLDVGSDSALLIRFGESLIPCIFDVKKISRTRVSALQELVGGVSGFVPCGFRRAFFGTEVLGQVIQKSAAIGIGNYRAQAFHFVELYGPSLSSQVLLGDATGVVTLGAGGFDFGLHGSGRKRLAWGAGRLRARQNNGCEQKDCWNNSLQQAESPSQFSELDVPLVVDVSIFCFGSC